MDYLKVRIEEELGLELEGRGVQDKGGEEVRDNISTSE
jgi:hypothetical protein